MRGFIISATAPERRQYNRLLSASRSFLTGSGNRPALASYHLLLSRSNIMKISSLLNALDALLPANLIKFAPIFYGYEYS